MVPSRSLCGDRGDVLCAGFVVKEKRGCSKSFSPEPGGHGGMKQHRVPAVIHSTQYTLSFAILLAGVRARETEDNVMLGEQRAQGEVFKLAPIVSLHGKDK